ncbi:MAG TPA: hypothetical protein VM325_19715 [Alphaproteobacteria bacterium]|nr:hypothetical protein [Alphaproteobacteria bacterium]
MTRRAASLTSSLMARKGLAGPSHLELKDVEQTKSRPTPPRLVSTTPGDAKTGATTRSRKSVKGADPDTDKRRFTLRLSEDQHIRMRLASVHLHMSAQQMVMKALDTYLAETVPQIRGGDCACVDSGKDGGKTKPGSAKGEK